MTIRMQHSIGSTPTLQTTHIGMVNPQQMDKAEVINVLQSHYDDGISPSQLHVNEMEWTIAELFIRQHLNTGCDGFGMRNVGEVYAFLYINTEKLIQYNLLGENGESNCGLPLWTNHDIPLR